MKIKFPSIALGAACALALAACGSGNDDYPDVPIQVNLVNVTMTGLALQLNDYPVEQVKEGSTFQFTKYAPANSRIKVSLVPLSTGGVQRPRNAEKCELFNGETTVGIYSPDNIVVSCTLYKFALGGKVEGPHNEDFIVANGAATYTVKPGDTTFALPSVAEAVPYNVAILQQPATSTCSLVTADGVDAPIGTMPGAALSNLKITCVPK